MTSAAQQAAVTTRHKYEQRCPDCGSSDFVDDFSAGDLICRECGLVVEAHAIDVRSEWRTFSDSDKQTVDPNRVGGPTNSLLGENALTTTIGAAGGLANDAASNALRRMAARSGGGGGASEKGLTTGFRGINAICDRLALVKIIRDRACEVFKKALESGGVKGRQAVAMHAACVYMACRLEHNPRTFKEILAGAPGTSKVDIGRAYTAIQRQLDQYVDAIHPADYVRRFCSQLGMSAQDMKVANEVAERASPRGAAKQGGQAKPWDGRTPISVAAGLILLIAVLPKASQHPSVHDISTVSGVADVTIRAAYADLRSDAVALVPAWFAAPETLAVLPQVAG